LRYGTLPIVRNTGGLADTVVDATEENRKNNTATGFKFENSTAYELEQTLNKVLELFPRPRIWRKMMLTAMMQDYSWQNSALSYQTLYDELLQA
jgi:starch synthase